MVGPDIGRVHNHPGGGDPGVGAGHRLRPVRHTPRGGVARNRGVSPTGTSMVGGSLGGSPGDRQRCSPTARPGPVAPS